MLLKTLKCFILLAKFHKRRAMPPLKNTLTRFYIRLVNRSTWIKVLLPDVRTTGGAYGWRNSFRYNDGLLLYVIVQDILKKRFQKKTWGKYGLGNTYLQPLNVHLQTPLCLHRCCIHCQESLWACYKYLFTTWMSHRIVESKGRVRSTTICTTISYWILFFEKFKPGAQDTKLLISMYRCKASFTGSFCKAFLMEHFSPSFQQKNLGASRARVRKVRQLSLRGFLWKTCVVSEDQSHMPNMSLVFLNCTRERGNECTCTSHEMQLVQ